MIRESALVFTHHFRVLSATLVLIACRSSYSTSASVSTCSQGLGLLQRQKNVSSVRHVEIFPAEQIQLRNTRASENNISTPNILFLFPDQWRYDWDGFHRHGVDRIPLHLPTMRTLAKRGVRFTHAYAPSPICVPSRSSLASGREYDRTEVPDNQLDFPKNITTFYNLLRSHGIHTMTAGKDDLTQGSNLGFNTGYPGCQECRDWNGLYRQGQLGFSDGLRFNGKAGGLRFDGKGNKTAIDLFAVFLKSQTVKTKTGKTIDAYQALRACMGYGSKSDCSKETFLQKNYGDDFTASCAVTLLRRRPRDRPFFLQVNFLGPHHPYVVTAPMRSLVSGRKWPRAIDVKSKFVESCKDEGEPDVTQFSRCNYAAQIENLDRLFKIVIDEVDAQGELDNTLIFVSSDHGDMLGDHGAFKKSKPWQGSVAVPLTIAGPGIPQGRVVTKPVSILDLVGTFLDYTRVRLADGMTTISMRSLLQPEAGQEYRSFVSIGYDNFRIVVKEIDGVSYKYICCKGKCPGAPSAAPSVSESGWMQMLIDVKADPFDMHDLSGDMPAVVNALRALLPSESYAGNFVAGCATILRSTPSFL